MGLVPPCILRTFHRFNARLRPILDNPIATRSISSSRISSSPGSNRSDRSSSRNRNRKINDCKGRMPIKPASSRPSSGINNRRSSYSKGMGKSSSGCRNDNSLRTKNRRQTFGVTLKPRRRGGGKVESVLCSPSAASFPQPSSGVALQRLMSVVFAARQHGPGDAG